MDPLTARKTWRTLEPVHGAIYFAPETEEEYGAIGLDARMSGYFASRSAPMGAVPASVVIATFFNFDHDLVRRCMDGVWEQATPDQVLVARLRVADRMIRRLAADTFDSPEIVEASGLARAAALAACERPEGRPLFAGHAALTWPDEPHLVLWHAQALLREYRGDGHIAALVAEGLSGCEALVTHGASGDVPAETLQSSRQRSDADWQAAIDRLQSIGWLDGDGAFTALGRERRDWIEQRTDELAAAPYDAIGIDGCDRLRALVRPTSRAMSAVFG
ncbi:MAG: hypothetical protein WBP59_14790 [Ilumatobacteraceae bacterium]